MKLAHLNMEAVQDLKFFGNAKMVMNGTLI
jgi:hypothetical protein